MAGTKQNATKSTGNNMAGTCDPVRLGGGLAGKFGACLSQQLGRQLNADFVTAAKAIRRGTTLCTEEVPQAHQKAVRVVASALAKNPAGNDRGMLLWTNAGSGKTVASLAIILAYWNTSKDIVRVSTRANNLDNSDKKYAQNMLRLFPKEARLITNMSAPRAKDVCRALERRTRIYTFEQATNAFGVMSGLSQFKKYQGDPKIWQGRRGSGSVIIIDEAQNMNIKEDASGYSLRFGQTLRALDAEKLKRVHVYGLTATPGATIREWLQLLSVVRPAHVKDFSTMAEDVQALIEKQLYQPTGSNRERLRVFINQYVAGLVLYADVRGDRSRHACVNQKIARIPMKCWYFTAYVDALGAYMRSKSSIGSRWNAQRPQQYFAAAKRFSNFLTATGGGLGAQGWMPAAGRREAAKWKLSGSRHAQWASAKLVALAHFVTQKAPGTKQYVYVTRGAETTLANALVAWHGFRNVTKECINGSVQAGKHFVVIDERLKESSQVGSSNSSPIAKMMAVVNHPKNITGKFVQVIIATGRYFEGLDISGLRYVHLAEPLHTALAEVQAVGRGVRMCGHKLLPPKDRNVSVVRWYSVAPAYNEWVQYMKNTLNIKPPKQARLLAQYQFIKDTLGTVSADEHVQQRSLEDPDYLAVYNFEELVKAASFACTALAQRYSKTVTCGKPALTRRVKLRAGSACLSAAS